MGDETNMKKKAIKNLLKASIIMIILTAFIFPESATFTNNYEINILSTMQAQWNVTLNCNESGGKMDYAVFGEALDANDGEPPDSYDAPKAPAPMPPYLRAWFDDGLAIPYDVLLEDFRRYPDTNKTWDLYIRWKSSDPNVTDVTITWNNSFIGCEYGSIVLMRYDPFNTIWEFATDMLLNDTYVYNPRWFNAQWLTDHFQIRATSEDTTPPETICILDGVMEQSVYISDVTVTLIATDDMSGVNYTMYKLDTGMWQYYAVPFVVSEDGDHIVYFYSVDFAENIEPEKNSTFTIQVPDTTPPETICILDGIMEGGIYITEVTVTLIATDDGSGVNYTMYKINEGVWQVYSEPFVISENGTYAIYFYSVDFAENVEPEKSRTFTIQISDVILKVAFIFGEIRNLTISTNFIAFNSVFVRYFSFTPFDFDVYDSGEQITVSTKFIGLLTFRFIFGFFKAA